MKAIIFTALVGFLLCGTEAARAQTDCAGSATLIELGQDGSAAFNIRSGEACIFGVRLEGVVNSSRIVQRPAHGTVTGINSTTLKYEASAGYRGRDRFVFEATGVSRKGRKGHSRVDVSVGVQ